MISDSEAIPHDNQMGKGSSSSAPIGYEPTPEEQQSIKLVDRCFQKAKNARKPYEEKWLDYYRFFRGKQWKDSRPSYRHSEVINLVFRAIQSDIPILTDSRPKPEFIPTEPGDLELAQILNDVLDSDWNGGNWLHQLTEILYDSHIYGAGFGCIKYDPDAALGAGKITFESADPFSIYPDPDAYDVNTRANYFIHAEPVSIDKLKEKYPHVKQYMKADLLDLSKRDRTNFASQVRYVSPTDGRSVIEGHTYDLESKDEALEIILYIHDSEYIEEEMHDVDPTTGDPKISYIQKKKYPNGRKIVVVNGVLCEEGEIGYDDQKFPYVRNVNYILPREFWGMSEVEQLESPQKIFNKLISFSLDVLTLMGNPIWVVDSTSGVDTDNLFNRPGLIVEKEPNTEVRREEGVQLQPYVLQMIDRLKTWFDDVSGSTDSSRGVRPEGVTAASAITALQEASQTRLRQKTRHTDSFMQYFGQMYASRVFQFYDAPRVFRVTNTENVTNYFKFHIEKQPVTDLMGQPTGEYQRIAKVRPFVQSPVDGQYYEGEMREYQMKGEFDVRVSGGSNLPFEKNRLEQQSLALFDRQIIDAEEVLKNIKYPNAEAVLKRMAEKQAQAAQAQAAAAPAPAQ